MLFIQLGIWGAWGIFGLVNEDSFDKISEKFKSGMYFTRGLYGKKGKGRALFIIDPDSNEKVINTRLLYGKPSRVLFKLH